ncbi:MAG: EamA family transporter [Cyanobacteria bacterium P01_F01_bin.150]
MDWLAFAVLTAVFDSLKNLVSKRGLLSTDEYVVAWASRFFALPLLIPVLFLIEQPTLGDRFWLLLPLITTIQVVANILYFRAIKVADLSLTIPMLALTPLFLIVVSPVIINEVLQPLDILGVVLITVGTYWLNLKPMDSKYKPAWQGYLAPIQGLWQHQGTRIMLLVSFFWSLLSTLNKAGIQQSSPLFWPLANSICLAIALCLIMLLKSRDIPKQLRLNWPSLLLVGLFQGLVLLCFMKALSLTLVARAVGVKRLSILFSILIGYWFFQEKGTCQRFMAASIMLLGVMVMTLT